MSLPKEGTDFDLVPVTEGHSQAWDVRILTGQFPETVIRYGNIAFDGDDGCLHFNFVLQSSPDGDLKEDNEELQKYECDILESILEVAADDGSLQYGEDIENRS